jgi:hypothetical protein
MPPTEKAPGEAKKKGLKRLACTRCSAFKKSKQTLAVALPLVVLMAVLFTRFNTGLQVGHMARLLVTLAEISLPLAYLWGIITGSYWYFFEYCTATKVKDVTYYFGMLASMLIGIGALIFFNFFVDPSLRPVYSAILTGIEDKVYAITGYDFTDSLTRAEAEHVRGLSASSLGFDWAAMSSLLKVLGFAASIVTFSVLAEMRSNTHRAHVPGCKRAWASAS